MNNMYEEDDLVDGRLNPVDKSPAIAKSSLDKLLPIDMNVNPRLTRPSAGEIPLPLEEKSEYWREELRRGKDPRDVLNQYLMDRMTQNERKLSSSYRGEGRTERQQDLKTNKMLDLLKSGADFGASFANQRWRDPRGDVPTSGYNPDIQKDYLAQQRKDMETSRLESDKYREIDQNVLRYLAEQKQKQESEATDRALKLEIAKMRAENDPFKALLFGIKQSEEKRQKGEYDMKQEAHRQKAEENRRKFNPANIKEKLENMNSTEKSATGFISEGLRALNDLESAEKAGKKEHSMSGGTTKWITDKTGAYPWRMSVIGDNPYTEASNRYKEFFGRMQSGGAIGTVEAGEFLGLIPKVFDTPDMAETKLNKMKEMFYNKARILGLERSDIDELITGKANNSPSKSTDKSSDKLNKLQNYYDKETNPQKKQELLKMIEIEKKRSS